MKSSTPANINLPEQMEGHRRRRYIVLGLFIAVLAAILYFGPMLRKQEPNYYDPARVALINAKQQFEESLVHEQVLIDQLNMARAELDTAISQLARVAALDPAHRAGVESLRANLLALENPEHPGTTSPEQLKQSYRELLMQMDALIKDMDRHNP